MAVFKCKMCGGSLEITDDQSVATCEYCGTQQTLPKANDDVLYFPKKSYETVRNAWVNYNRILD